MGLFTYPVPLTIDGRPVTLRVARLCGRELATFRAAWESRQAANTPSDAFLRRVIELHTSAVLDGRTLTGYELLAQYRDRLEVLGAVASEVYLQNILTRHEKRALRRLQPRQYILGRRPAGRPS
jgi:hypothetical protein